MVLEVLPEPACMGFLGQESEGGNLIALLTNTEDYDDMEKQYQTRQQHQQQQQRQQQQQEQHQTQQQQQHQKQHQTQQQHQSLQSQQVQPLQEQHQQDRSKNYSILTDKGKKGKQIISGNCWSVKE
ncbi:transcription activator MSS11-like [Lytechinus variegatus]|uniref:transcription activator MSS11-like n=1 Tax=Lytechinus variegatus TaxID=7654 RepID=UPI001BB28C3A|nr:transcription activator MSS11-like [Lytechinus variegatus]